MKGKTDMYKKTVLSALALMCAAMTACSAANDSESSVSDTESVTEIVSSAETTEITSETASQISETTVQTISETAEAEVTADTPEKISVKAENMTFTDFAFIEYYKGSKQEDKTSEKAIEFLKTTEEYAQSQKYSDFYKEKYPEYFDENGVLVPKLHESYTEDYDGDGREETFLLIDMPYSNYIDPDDPSRGFSAVYSFLIFIGNDGNAELIDYNCGLYYPQLLDYGYNKQLVIGGAGSCGAEDHTIIWTVRDGKVYALNFFRGSVTKQDCFISVFGWQSMGGTMIFDPEKVMYIPVEGVPCDKDELRKMDTDKSIESLYYEESFGDYPYISLIGGKYYCVEAGFMDSGRIYTYSDGHFVLEINSKIRTNHIYIEDMPDYSEFDNEVLIDFDYDKVTAEMTTVKAKMPSYSVDDLEKYQTEKIEESYAAFSNGSGAKVIGFYGVYDCYSAIKMSDSDEVLIYYPYYYDNGTANFLSIETARSEGIISDSNLVQLDSVLKNAE